MKKILFALLTVTFLAGIASADDKNYAEGQALVVFRAPENIEVSASGLGAEGGIRASVVSAAEEAGAEVLEVYETLSEIDGNIFALVRSKTKTTEELITELKARPDVVTASPNHKVRPQSTGIRPNDASFDVQWGLEAIRAPEAWQETTGSENVYAAVIDMGFYVHDDLKENLAMDLGYNIYLKENLGWSIDVSGHGTHVAGTIGAVGNNSIGVSGVNWTVNIIPVSFLDISEEEETDDEQNETEEFSSAMAEGLNYIASILNKNPDMKIAAVNMSVSFYFDENPEQMKDDVLYHAFKAFDNLNRTLIVVAASNEGIEVGKPAPFDEPGEKFRAGQYVYPGSFTGLNNMIVVGAIDADNKASEFTCWGDSVDIAAPGSKVFSTYSPETVLVPAGGPVSYSYSSGTSMAAPFVTGAAALLLSRYPDATPAQLKNAILSGANPNINPTVHPFNYEDLLKSMADDLGYEYTTVEDIERYAAEEAEEYGFNMIDTIIPKVNAYKVLDGKGKVSRRGLLDVKAALDVLAVSQHQSTGSSGGGCSGGIYGWLGILAVLFITSWHRYCRR
ncbi:MAG: S8 family serine peptidase [Synergistaceae bacterium]|nr:S8 family serine peptidase [Synergistaceae bacterium]